MSNDEEFASDVPPRYLFFISPLTFSVREPAEFLSILIVAGVEPEGHLSLSRFGHIGLEQIVNFRPFSRRLKCNYPRSLSTGQGETEGNLGNLW